MKSIELGGGVKLSEICLGAGKLGTADFPDDKAFEIMDRYLELGGSTFDTARLYAGGECDRALGRWLKSRGVRDDVTIVTKGSHHAFYTPRLAPEEIELDLEHSLRDIGIECSDLHLLHRDDIKRPVSDIVSALDSLVRAGKTRAVGVSNWTASRIAQANAFAAQNGLAPLRCCQAHYGLAQTTAAATGDLTHIPMCDVELGFYRESGFALMAYGSQARGWFVVRAAGGEPKESPRRFYDEFPQNRRRLERLLELSRETGRSLAALTAAYARDSLPNSAPLCAFTSVSQLEESLDVLNFTLSPSQIAWLETGMRHISPSKN